MAHRGAIRTLPENSLPAFAAAIQDGADAIETDLWLTRDGAIVCHHDETVERMTGEPRRVGELTLGELRRLTLLAPDGGPTTAAVPTLAELLDLTPPDTALALELKDPRLAVEPGVRALELAIADRVAARTVVAVSFSLRRLLRARRAIPGLPIGPISTLAPLPWQPGELVGPYWPLVRVNPWYVALAHLRHKLVCPLDPHPHERLGRYLDMGVDAILTDEPAATRALIEARRAS